MAGHELPGQAAAVRPLVGYAGHEPLVYPRLSARENLEDLQNAPLQWLAAFADGALVGAVAWSEDRCEVDIDRLLVAPSAHRRRVGSALVRAVLLRAGGRRTTVSTGRDNTPARNLYERLGFSCAGEEEVIPGLWITRYALPD